MRRAQLQGFTQQVEQQSELVIHRTRMTLMRHRIELSNTIRAHMAEFGLIALIGRRGLQGEGADPEPGRGFHDPAGSADPAAVLRAIERAGTTKNHDVIKTLEGHVIKDNFRKYPSTIRPWDHLVGQMLYLAKTKKEGEMKEKWDMIEMISEVAPEVAAPPQSISKCKMQSLAETPVYGG